MDKYFDFVCISLKHRDDRRKSSQKLFRNLNINKLVNWWVVDRHPSGGVYGCFESHVSVWNCSEFIKPFLCVFEDDLTFNEVNKVNGTNSINFKQALKYAYRNMPRNFNILNLVPILGFNHQQISPFAYLGTYTNCGCYIIHRSTLPLLTARVLPWYGMDIDIALYKNCKMAGIFPPIFKPDDYGSDVSRTNLVPKEYKELYRKIIESSMAIGWIVMEMCQRGALYSIYNQPCPELKDRRCRGI